jgi:isopenicillin N synthase-like dioxygenase
VLFAGVQEFILGHPGPGMAAPQVNLPVIELARLEDSADALRGACHAVGFFYLDTGSTELETRALAAASQFFALPMAEKRKLDNTASPHW